MASGLNINNEVNITVNWQQAGVSTRNFGALLIVGRAGVLSDSETTRVYQSISEVEQDFTTSTCEYQAAQAFFAQTPQPSIVYIGAWQTSETPQQCVARLRSASTDWYAIFFALDGSTNSPLLTPTQIQNVSNFIQAASTRSLFLVNTQDESVASGSTTDIASTTAQNFRTVWMYSSQSLYAAVALFGLFATVDYSGNDTVLTAAYKQLATITPDNLTFAQATALNNKNVNYYANFNDGGSYVLQGVTSNGLDISAVIGVDAFRNACQTSIVNYLSGQNVVPYDIVGISGIKSRLNQVGAQFVLCGLIGENKQWTMNSIGALRQGSILRSGYYFNFNKLTSMTTAQIQKGIAPYGYGCINLAGAIKSLSIGLYIGQGG